MKIFVKRNSLFNEDTGIQEKARKVRYSWFNNLRLKYNFDFIITAHHANDQAETILMNLSRKSGVAGLRGISKEKDKVLRPLLNFTKTDILNFSKVILKKALHVK